MGWGDLVAEEVSAAQTDMAKVQAAADAISQAIGKVRPWLSGDTWQGPDATSWIGDWQSFYQGVQSCLNSLPNAETEVVSQVRQQAEKLAQQHAGQPAPA